MPNRLAGESSPYLLQHKDNPVDWYPWGPEALAAARERDVPILLSIGYSACHWCHVMERESFEDPETAAFMNERFVCIKLDREERPGPGRDLHGGVPGHDRPRRLAAERVPDARAGALLRRHLLPAARNATGMPSWTTVLDAVREAWDERADEIRATSDKVAERLQGGAALQPAEPTRWTRRVLDTAMEGLRRIYDAEHGGFGGAPKFPPASTIEFLLARGETEMSLDTLRAMAGGGMYDQVGGGFARYSVDARWLVPHFEKMLYDNALLARAYLHGWQVSGDELLRRVCEETLDWMLAEMRGPEGGFMSALDADSEGEEGLFYVWTPDQLREVLGPEDAEAAAALLRRPPRRQLRGPHDPDPRRQRARRTWPTSAGGCTRRARERVWPGLDDKRLTAWNALAIAALAEAGAVLERPRLPGRRPRRGRVRAARPARRRRPPAAHLQGRPGQAERLPGGPRLPARRAADACTSPRSSRAGSPRRGRWPTR